MKPKSSPTYIQIEEQLITYFRQNHFTYGDKLPTEHQLMDRFSVSRTTIRKALEILKNKNLIDKNRGSGTFYTGRQKFSKNVNSTKTLGLVNYFFMDYIYTEILRGIEDEVQNTGYSLAISNSNKNEEKQYDAIKRLIDQGVDGLILEPARSLQIGKDHPILSLLESTNIPVLLYKGILRRTLLFVVFLDFLPLVCGQLQELAFLFLGQTLEVFDPLGYFILELRKEAIILIHHCSRPDTFESRLEGLSLDFSLVGRVVDSLTQSVEGAGDNVLQIIIQVRSLKALDLLQHGQGPVVEVELQVQLLVCHKVDQSSLLNVIIFLVDPDKL